MSTASLFVVDTASLLAGIDEADQAVEDSARAGAQAGVQVLYDEIEANVAALGRVSGTLAESIYQVYSRDKSYRGLQVYETGWNSRKAPHGHLVENGHIQRYVVYVGKDGLWHTAVRPSMRGEPKPPRKASQAVKDAYYVPLPGGPRQVPAQSFVRKAMAKFPQAMEAAIERMGEELAARGVVR